ncbi:MAG: phosphoribosylamine--glycine ligase [Devosiaceae bacterium]|nr:phosphoribosylamine--glycine ligase [Devosiaceae bacterium]
MNILLIGSGGREHALAYKIAQSKRLNKLYIATGNAGTSEVGDNIALDVENHQKVIEFCKDKNIGLVIVGPEMPLVAGIADDLRAANILTFGPSKAASELEGSKIFTKKLCNEMNIPTAYYAEFSDELPALEYVREQGAPIVIKADGLAAGKGVVVALSLEQAEQAIRDCFSGAFGAAGEKLVIEEFLDGEEVSIFAICDGENFITLASAQDHKRAFDGDKGPNTGGMGAYSPAPMVDNALLTKIEKQIIAPTILGMKQRGTPFSGVLFAGLMIKDNQPKLIEHNVRFGDPECQTLMMRLKSDLLDLLEASAKGDISNVKPQWHEQVALCVVMAANGYPSSYQKGTIISGLENIDDENVKIFHAGTKKQGDKILANGGRVLNITAMGDSVKQAQTTAYQAIKKINWQSGFYRTDIGYKAILSEQNN